MSSVIHALKAKVRELIRNEVADSYHANIEDYEEYKLIPLFKMMNREIKDAGNLLNLLPTIPLSREQAQRFISTVNDELRKYLDDERRVRRAKEEASLPELTLDELVIEPDEEEVLALLEEEGKIKYNLPIVGTVEEPLSKVLQMLERSKVTIRDIIKEELDKILSSGPINQEFWQWHGEKMKELSRLQITLNSLKKDVSDSFATLINTISTINLGRSKEIDNLVELLKNSTLVDFEVEISEPDTTDDGLYAQAIAYCEEGNINGLKNIALQFGYLPSEISNMSVNDLCRLIDRYFKY